MRYYVAEWIKQCLHCILLHHWRRYIQDLIFSWPVSSPFAILHVDLWMLGNHTDSNGNMALMNATCNMSHFVVVVPILAESSATLASNFM